MPSYRIDIEYDGTDFKGWQIQPKQRTVQGELCVALETIFRGAVPVVGAGRTDAGVHALGQVASFTTSTARNPDKILRSLNSLLPGDIHVRRVSEVAEGFSARHSAVARSYRFQMRRSPSAIWRRYYYELRSPVNIEAMSAAAELFLGDHDFTAFVAADAGDRCRCVVVRSEVRANDEEVFFDITADHFLHNMVRRLTGALVEVGRGRLTTDGVRTILSNRDRSRGGPCLPPNGLFLVGVRYAPDGARRVDGVATDV